MIRVGRAGIEVEMFVESPRAVIPGMNQQRPDTCNVGGLRRSL